MRVVISQPMYFPWLGQLNQALLADAFVFYSDVQFARGFTNRVQLLIDGKQEFITVPTVGSKRSNINELTLDSSQPWKERHLAKLKHSLGKSPFFDIVIKVFDDVTSSSSKNLAELSSASVRRLCEEIFPDNCPFFYDSRNFSRQSKSTQSLVDICKELGATHYLTGHGAKNYINANLFAREGIELEYISYQINPYSQDEGKHITSYVSALDAIARMGPRKAHLLLASTPVPAADFHP